MPARPSATITVQISGAAIEVRRDFDAERRTRGCPAAARQKAIW
jgi:hypothetical protein